MVDRIQSVFSVDVGGLKYRVSGTKYSLGLIGYCVVNNEASFLPYSTPSRRAGPETKLFPWRMVLWGRRRHFPSGHTYCFLWSILHPWTRLKAKPSLRCMVWGSWRSMIRLVEGVHWMNGGCWQLDTPASSLFLYREFRINDIRFLMNFQQGIYQKLNNKNLWKVSWNSSRYKITRMYDTLAYQAGYRTGFWNEYKKNVSILYM